MSTDHPLPSLGICPFTGKELFADLPRSTHSLIFGIVLTDQKVAEDMAVIGKESIGKMNYHGIRLPETLCSVDGENMRTKEVGLLPISMRMIEMNFERSICGKHRARVQIDAWPFANEEQRNQLAWVFGTADLRDIASNLTEYDQNSDQPCTWPVHN